jgi:hypothetical protein
MPRLSRRVLSISAFLLLAAAVLDQEVEHLRFGIFARVCWRAIAAVTSSRRSF